MGKAYDRVMEIRKELTKQLISEMSQGELCWTRAGTVREKDRTIQ